MTVSVISLFLQPMEPYLDRQEVLGQREKEGTLAPEEIRVRSKKNRGNTAYISEWCSSRTGRSLRHFLFRWHRTPRFTRTARVIRSSSSTQGAEEGSRCVFTSRSWTTLKKTSTSTRTQLSFITCLLHSFSGNKVVGRHKRDRRQARGG